MGTPGDSGRNSSGRPGTEDGPGKLSDRWSDDDVPHSRQPVYDMTMPEDEKAAMGMASPLIKHRGGDLEKGMTGDGMTVPAGRGATEFGARSSAPKDVRDHVKQVIEQNKALVRPSVVRNLVVTYTVTVAVVILLSIAGQVVVHVYIENSTYDAVIINVSGRQRMLSQLITKDVLALAFLSYQRFSGHYDDPTRLNGTYFVNELRNRFALWVASHDALLNGSSVAIPGLNPLPPTYDGRILELAAQQQAKFEAMKVAIENVLEIPNLDNVTFNSSTFANMADQIDTLLANEGSFWKLQDNMTNYYQQNADSHLNLVLILSWVLHALVILTLILEGLFVFWPVARSLQRLIDERFTLIRRSLETEAENRGVSILMMGYISHELKQPLANLTEHLDNARDYMRSLEGAAALDHSNSDGTPLRGAVTQLEKAILCSELLNTVSGDITNLRNIELGRMALVVEVVDVADVIQQVLSVLAPKVPEGVQLLVEVSPTLEGHNRRMDRHRLQQIILNLVDNAFRTTQEGEVVVRASEGKAAGTLRFEVQDSGEGLTEEQRQSLFDPTLDSSGLREGNTNLSLYVVKLLVDLQNGKFGVEPVAGGGNVHWVELPAVDGGPGAQASQAPPMRMVPEIMEPVSGRTNSSSGRIVPEDVPSNGVDGSYSTPSKV